MPVPVPDPVLVYDGDCGFCARSLGWLRALGGRCAAVPWQLLDLGPLGLSEEDVTEAAWFLEGPYADAHDDAHVARRWRGHEAIGRALETSRQPWVRLLGRVVRSRALRPLAAPVYTWVSHHRDRLPGGTPACARIEP